MNSTKSYLKNDNEKSMTLNTFKNLVYFPIMLLFTGCSIYSGFLRDASNTNEHQFKMDVAEMQYKKSIAGVSEVGYVFCSIPVENSDLFRNAMNQLNSRAELSSNQVLENIREDHELSIYLPFLPIYCKKRLVISADVYEMIPTGRKLSSENTPPRTSATESKRVTRDTPPSRSQPRLEGDGTCSPLQPIAEPGCRIGKCSKGHWPIICPDSTE